MHDDQRRVDVRIHEDAELGAGRIEHHFQVRLGRIDIAGATGAKVLDLQGVRGVQEYLVREIQAVYKNQGVDINDKHVEIIVRQMLKKRKIVHAGDTMFLPGQVVDKFEFEDENQRVINAGGTPAIRNAGQAWV